MTLVAKSLTTPTYDPKVGWSRLTSVTGGKIPPYEEFMDRFGTVCANSFYLFSFSDDAFVGTDKLTCSELWDMLHELLHDSETLDPETQMTDIEEAYSWCSDVLGILGWEWVLHEPVYRVLSRNHQHCGIHLTGCGNDGVNRNHEV